MFYEIRTKTSSGLLSEPLFGMRHTFYSTSTGYRGGSINPYVFGPHNELRWPTDGALNALCFCYQLAA